MIVLNTLSAHICPALTAASTCTTGFNREPALFPTSLREALAWVAGHDARSVSGELLQEAFPAMTY